MHSESIPLRSKAILTPTALSAENPGIYSIAFRLKDISKIVASDLKINKPSEEIPVVGATTFDCPALDIDQNVIVYLMDNKKQPLAGANIAIFNEFEYLEPTKDSSTSPFEPQILKYFLVVIF